MPFFPLELERLIFEIAALQDTNHNSRVRILLVAKRVYEWIRPILYRVIVTEDSVSPSLPETFGTLTFHNWRNAQIINAARFVRHFLAVSTMDSHAFAEMISTFPNVENLAIWCANTITPELLNKMNDLPLRMLSADVRLEKIQSCPVFKKLTHLEIFNLMKLTREDCRGFIELPRLTHLCFDTFDLVEDAALLLDLLKHCASLRVLLFQINTYARAVEGVETITLGDPRYLVLVDRMAHRKLMEEWERSAHGLTGCWELAEIIVEARKANLFKDKSSFIFSRETWMERLNGDGMRWYEEWVSQRL